MAMNYEELDEKTRLVMLQEFEDEQAGGTPYVSKGLNNNGCVAFPGLMRAAIKSGNEVSLSKALNDAVLWKPFTIDINTGGQTNKPRNIPESAAMLGLGEFSTWYVRGLARKLLNEGQAKCQIYRGEAPIDGPGECSKYEGMIVETQLIYDNHRARYWPLPGNPDALSVPFGPFCHHVIRRMKYS
jgi:hypothetical protein